jgi:mannose-6-phosphate isomerase-like protein (cupin superfamily)
MPAVRTASLTEHPSYISPGGVAEIRLLLQFPAGEITHAKVPAEPVSLTSRVQPSSEWFYVLGGSGQLWDGYHDTRVDLKAGRCVGIAPGTPFQYRAVETLEMLVMVMPQWRPEYHAIVGGGPWSPTEPAAVNATEFHIQHPAGIDVYDLRIQHPAGIDVYDLKSQPDYAAPDQSNIWLLGSEPAGGIAICTLAPGRASVPVRHRTVEELWYVIDGRGEIARRHGDRDAFIDELESGVCLDVGTGITFQFRALGDHDLTLLLLTMPAWPGADEAIAEPDRAAWPS